MCFQFCLSRNQSNAFQVGQKLALKAAGGRQTTPAGNQQRPKASPELVAGQNAGKSQWSVHQTTTSSIGGAIANEQVRPLAKLTNNQQQKINEPISWQRPPVVSTSNGQLANLSFVEKHNQLTTTDEPGQTMANYKPTIESHHNSPGEVDKLQATTLQTNFLETVPAGAKTTRRAARWLDRIQQQQQKYPAQSSLAVNGQPSSVFADADSDNHELDSVAGASNSSSSSSYSELPSFIREFKSDYSAAAGQLAINEPVTNNATPKRQRMIDCNATDLNEQLDSQAKDPAAAAAAANKSRIVQRDLAAHPLVSAVGVGRTESSSSSFVPVRLQLRQFDQHQDQPVGRQSPQTTTTTNQHVATQGVGSDNSNNNNNHNKQQQNYPSSRADTAAAAGAGAPVAVDSIRVRYGNLLPYSSSQLATFARNQPVASGANQQQQQLHLRALVPAAMALIAQAAQQQQQQQQHHQNIATSRQYLVHPGASSSPLALSTNPRHQQSQLRLLTSLASQHLLFNQQQQQQQQLQNDQQSFSEVQQLKQQAQSGATGQQLASSPASESTNANNLTDQLIVASNQLGVSHLGPSSSGSAAPSSSSSSSSLSQTGALSASESASYNSLANYQDYSDYRPMDPPMASVNTAGNSLASTVGEDRNSNNQQANYYANQPAGLMVNSSHWFQQFNGNAPGGEQANSRSSSSSLSSLPASEGQDQAGSAPSQGMASAYGAAAAAAAAAATSLDPYEDYSNGLSTSEYEQDLADLDEEFNKHVGFGRRPSGSAAAAAATASESDRYEPTASGRYRLRPSATYAAASEYQAAGDHLATAGSVANLIPRHFHHHHHGQPATASAAHRSQQAPLEPTGAVTLGDLWAPESAYEFGYSPLAAPTYLGQSYAAPRWRYPRYQQLAAAPPLATAASYLHQQRLMPAYYYAPMGPAAYAPPDSQAAPSGYSFVPSYAPSVAAAAAAPPASSAQTETVSFTLSPLAAAAAAAATALAAVDKSRNQNHGSWTFTLPRLATSLASGSSLGLSGSSGAGGAGASTVPAPAASSPQSAASQAPAAYAYRHNHLAPYYLAASVPIYAALAPRAPASASASGGPLAASASGATPSISLPYFAHPQPHQHASHHLLAYRPTNGAGASHLLHPHPQQQQHLAAHPLVASFAYAPATYQRLPYAPIHSAHYIAAPSRPGGGAIFPSGSAGLLLASPPSASASASPSSLSSSSLVRPAHAALAAAGYTTTSSATKQPSYLIDLQLAETKSKSASPPIGGGDSSSALSKGSKAASSLTAMARNLTKKMFGSASQIRPQHVAPPQFHIASDLHGQQQQQQQQLINGLTSGSPNTMQMSNQSSLVHQDLSGQSAPISYHQATFS